MTTTDKLDSWANDLTSLGSTYDKATGVEFRKRLRLSQTQLSSLYEQHPLAAKVVDLIVDEAFRTPWKVVGEGIDSKAVDSWCDDLRIDEQLSIALKLSRLYGGALLALPTADGQDPSLPLRPGSPLFTPAAFDAYDCRPVTMDDGFGSSTYRQTLEYEIQSLTGQSIRVHRSRVIPFEPIPLPARESMHSLTLWGPSVLDRVYDDLSAWGAAKGHAASAMYVSSLLVLKLQGFREDRSSKGGPERMRQRLSDTKRSLDMLGIFGLDDEDDLSSVSMPMTGLHEIMDRLRDSVAASSEMPREILFNESPAGLAGGDLSGPQQLWYGRVETYRQKVINPALDRILSLLLRSKGVNVDEWTIEWAPLWTPSATSEATNAATWAAADQIYYNMGADPEKILSQRFVDGNKSHLHFEPDRPAEPLDLAAEGEVVEPVSTASSSPTPQDTAMNGAQITSMLEVLRMVNAGELTYDQGIGVLGSAFASLRGREASVLGPRPQTPPPSLAAEGDEPDPLNGPSDDPIPDDVMSPREAAAKYRVSTRTITRMMETAAIRYWGLGSHKRVSLADIAKAARAHENPIEEEADHGTSSSDA